MSIKILLVDDEEGIRNVLSIYLEDAGYEVFTADNGSAASKKLKTILPDIVLTDIKMPGMNGFDLLKFVKDNQIDAEVIMITGHGDLKLAMKSLKMDAIDFITKPIDNDTLDIALKRAKDKIQSRRTIKKYTEDLEALVKEKTHKLAASEQKYIRLFNESPSFISIQDNQYNILESNHIFQKHFNITAKKKCYEVYKNLSDPCPNCPVKKTFEDGKSHTAEMDVTLENGSVRNIFIQTSPMTEPDGRIQHVMEMSTDITIIRKLQDHLASLGLHIASVSHGIKGALTGLDGGTYLINSGLKKQDIPQIKEGWDIVRDKISKVRHMVLNILFQSKDRKLQKKKVSSTAFIRELASTITPGLDKTGIQINIRCPETDFKVSMDKAVFFTAILGILENSVDACLAVKHKKENLFIDLSAQKEGSMAVFTIKDNGKGLPRHQLDNIFSLFYSDKGNKGTGLGLFIAKKTVDKHQGRINVDSIENAYTKFTITLPL